MSDNILIQAEGLYRNYGNYCAVKNINLQLKKGEVLGLLGPNGAGKSTTMQMLTGNLSPSQGEIKIKDIDLLDKPKQAKRHIGYLPERPPIYKDMRVDEYLNYSAKLRHVPTSQLSTAIAQAKIRCGLDSVGNRLIANLSKGFQQRVGIAQAILHTPDIVILDEPTVGLDPIQIQEIRSLIRELGNHHSVILSTHILPEVQAVCDRVQIIHQGETVFDDSLDNLENRHSNPILIAQFTQAIDETKLASVQQIENFTAIDDHCYQLQHVEGTNLAPIICELAHTEGWEIKALTPQSSTLEQIFMDLIHGEEQVA